MTPRMVAYAAVFIGVLSGCSKPAPPAAAPGPDAGASPVHESGQSAAKRDSTSAVREITIAAAADLRFALPELMQAFQQVHPGVQSKLTFGSSGSLFAQIENGAPFDVFLSADIQYPEQLGERGQADPSTIFAYAVGHLVLWVPQTSKLDIEQVGIAAVLDDQVQKIAIANPKTAPYGRAAEAALKSLNVYDAVQTKLVLGENVTQAAQFVESGAADIGLIGLSLAKAPTLRDKGKYWPVPATAHPPLVQGGVILKNCREPAAAAEFQAFLTSPAARPVFEKYGFDAPPAGR